MKGVVIDTRDPLHKGRVKLVVPGIIDTEVSALPWVEYRGPYTGGTDAGSLVIPNEGDWVFVEEDSPNEYYYYGSWNSLEDFPKEATTKHKKVLYKSPTGHTIFIDDTPGAEKLRIIDRAGQIIEMFSPMKEEKALANRRGFGNVVDGGAKTVGNMTGPTGIRIKDLAGNQVLLNAKDNKIVISSTGNVEVTSPNQTVTASGTLQITGHPIKLNAGTAGVHTQQTIPFSDFSGRPYMGVSEVKAG